MVSTCVLHVQIHVYFKPQTKSLEEGTSHVDLHPLQLKGINLYDLRYIINEEATLCFEFSVAMWARHLK